MKLFISADIEGCAGVALTDETHKKESVYQRFAEEMTEEVVAACEAAHEAGADEIVVKDGHGDASNIDPLKMPEYVTPIRLHLHLHIRFLLWKPLRPLLSLHKPEQLP